MPYDAPCSSPARRRQVAPGREVPGGSGVTSAGGLSGCCSYPCCCLPGAPTVVASFFFFKSRNQGTASGFFPLSLVPLHPLSHPFPPPPLPGLGKAAAVSLIASGREHAAWPRAAGWRDDMPSPRLADATRIWDAVPECIRQMLMMKQVAFVSSAYNVMISVDPKPLCYCMPLLFPSFKGS